LFSASLSSFCKRKQRSLYTSWRCIDILSDPKEYYGCWLRNTQVKFYFGNYNNNICNTRLTELRESRPSFFFFLKRRQTRPSLCIKRCIRLFINLLVSSSTKYYIMGHSTSIHGLTNENRPNGKDLLNINMITEDQNASNQNLMYLAGCTE
jgi:hypothetical protein